MLQLPERHQTTQDKMKRFFTILFSLILLTSCESIGNLFSGDKVARVGSYVLYERDLRSLIPLGTSKEDSIQMVQQYINSWAVQNLKQIQAEQELSSEEKDITAEIEEFKKTLLAYRYEKLYVEQRLDTLITEKECEDYYRENLHYFISSTPIFKARVIKINPLSSNYLQIKKLYKSTKEEDLHQLDELCSEYAEKYIDFDGQWTVPQQPADYVGITPDQCVELLGAGNSFEVENPANHYFVYIDVMNNRGKVAPFEYVEPKIKESILSKRKQQLLQSLEQDLLRDAVSNNKLKIYDKE